MTHIRSFVRRCRCLTPAQQDVLDTLWPLFGVENDQEVLDLNALFGREAKKKMEIGFGRGDALVTMAKTHPEHDYLGIDVYRPGTNHLLKEIKAAQLTNVRVLCADAVDVLQYRLPEQCLDAIYLFFPDPWPKKRHHKRRLVQPEFVHLIATRIKSGGCFHLATDWQNYAEQMLQVLEAAPEFINCVKEGKFAPRPSARPLTKFEQRGRRLGHDIRDLLYRRE